MPRRSSFDFISFLVILILIVAGFFGGKFFAEFRNAGKADLECLEKIRQNGEVVLSKAVMERLLIIEDEEATYGRIKLILSVPVEVEYSADLALTGLREDENGLVMQLPEVKRTGIDYRIDEAEIIDLSSGYGIPVPRGNYQEMYSFFEQAVDKDRAKLELELDGTGYTEQAEQNLRKLVSTLTASIEVLIVE